jgi:hypothetical protein
MDRLHRRQVQQDPIVAGAKSGTAVPAATNGWLQISLLSEQEPGMNVCAVEAAGYERGAAIHAPVPDPPRGVIRCIIWRDQNTLEPGRNLTCRIAHRINSCALAVPKAAPSCVLHLSCPEGRLLSIHRADIRNTMV